MDTKLLLVIGAGPGVGASVARRFGREGYSVALVARSAARLEGLAAGLRQAGVTADWAAVDVADADALRAAIEGFGRSFGRIDVLHYNPSVFRERDPMRLTVDELLDDVRVGVAGLLAAVQAARPFMSHGGRIIATGSVAADSPWHEACSLGVQKAGLRNLVLSLDRTLAPDGIRATSVTVQGVLAPDTPFSPDRVADALYAATIQDRDEEWSSEIVYGG